MEPLLESQDELAGRIARAYDNLKKLGAAKITQGAVESRLGLLRKNWEKFDQQHDQLLALVPAGKRNVPYFEAAHYEVTEEMFLIQEALFVDKQQTFTIDHNASIMSNSCTPAVAHSKASLPRLPLPEFNGNYESWPEFRDLFRSLVIRDGSLTDIERLHYLRGCLKGDALLALRNLPVRAATFARAWDLLQDHYENERLLVQAQMATIFGLPTLTPVAHSKASLPRLPLPEFNGNYESWPEFRDLFRSLVIRDGSLTDIERLHYLRGCLKGDALLALRNLPVRAATFARAWDLLQDHYENERLLVQAQMATIFGLPTLTRESATELKTFYFTICDCVEALAAMERPFDATGDWLIYWVVEKLDQHSRREWETQLGAQTIPPTFEELKAFIKNRITTVGALEGGKSRGQPEEKAIKTAGGQKSAKVLQVTKTNRYQDPCGLCGANHFVLFCSIYRLKNVRERREALMKANLCYNCLGRHQVKDCGSDKRCQLCNGKHHTTIHEDGAGTSTVTEVTANASSCAASSLPAVLLATARVRVLPPNGDSRIVRALVDQGSEVSLITAALAQQLFLQRRATNIRLIGVGSQLPERVRGKVQLNFTAHTNSTERHVIEALVLPRITAYQPRLSNRASTWTHLYGLPLADPRYDGDGPIDLLLGADAFALILRDGLIKGGIGEPMAQNTTLGWIVSGPATQEPRDDDAGSHALMALKCTAEEELTPLVRRFWEQEEVVVTPAYTAEQQSCEDHYRTTHQRLPSGRYMVRLPFHDDRELGASLHGARRMLLRMEAKFQRDPIFAQAYGDFMREYLQLTHMTKTRGDITGPAFYLPHHGVLKESSTTTKLRVVFNGSYVTSSGQSLNERLMVGPNLLPSLHQLVLRWRIHRVCLTADIEKMYRQILLHPDDRQYQLILWRETGDTDISTFKLNTVTYGLACAPYLAIRTLRQLANDERARHPRAAAILERDVYVDDVVTGADSVQEALEIQEDLRQLCTAGGFNLRKWASNQLALREQVPTGDAIPECKWQTGETHQAHYIHWSPADDSFRVRVQPIQQDIKVTRRTVLSKIAKIFDPLGLVSPVTVNAKIFMQSLWLINIDWDTPLPSTETEYWHHFLDKLPELNRIAVPRWLGLHQSLQNRELHGFADASERAYAAVVYLRVVDHDGIIRTQLVTAKTKVAPLKKISLPRLELCAATLVTRLLALTRETLGLEGVPVHLWSDSTITLAWIQGHPAHWKTYVANRVSEVQPTLPDAHWHHVSSQDNPADCASRGLPPNQLPDFTLWWNGPSWLITPTGWDDRKYSEVPPTDLETRTTAVMSRLGDPTYSEEMLNKYSCITSLLRVTAWCLRWLPQHATVKRENWLNPAEIEAARTRWLRLVQHQAFAADIHQLELGQPLPSRSTLLSLHPYLDDDGLLRVGGRLRWSTLPLDAQHQVILPRDSRLTELLVVDAHHRTLHGGTQLTLTTLRQRYWVLQGRQRVKALIHRCVTCTRWRATTGRQLMGDLPSSRVTPARPFLHVGVDYAGPLTLLAVRGRGHRTHKGYVAVFVCLCTRAVHLELVSECSTEAFLAALRRFTSRRGLCNIIQSDQGTNFVGAARELREMLTHLTDSQEVIRSTLLKDGIEWRFNPPAAPHFGGLWEAAVKSTKHHLRRVLGEQHLTFEEMTTLLTQIEACLNSRPLQAISDDPGDFRALTPGHFLIGEPLLSVPDPPLDGIPTSRLTRWHLLQQTRLHFWKRWAAEYLQALQARNKWTHQQPQPRIGDLCLIKSELTSPGQWPLARISRLHAGSDGLTRVVTVKTANSEFVRPITKLVFLPMLQE